MMIYKSIVIKNIFYMLSYAYKVLNQNHYKKIELESFEHMSDLFAEILIKAVTKQLKQGLFKNYNEMTDSITTVRGKININKTFQNRVQRNQLITCEFDELSANNIYNQILKRSLLVLLYDYDVIEAKKVKIKRLLNYFEDIDAIELERIDWSQLEYHRNNGSYEMILNLCKILIESKLQSTESGELKFQMFTDDNMALLYERFVREYYKKHYPNYEITSTHINWRLDNKTEHKDFKLLPIMKSDIVITRGNKTLIIDTKFYTNILTDFQKFHSPNLYQIFTYVKNYDRDSKNEVAGMLLYAKTENDIDISSVYNMDGNNIYVKTIDLNQDFNHIKYQLDNVINEYFNL
ncbi:5-methylcytosine restriction system specificity protein McrC [Abyssicoccus albus]|uniref:5-methylcytosine-specific restriction enzyme subunit McrC n=1 Tax=Abyssicoccus albus TaxID=1817405 RepID=A0A3N5BN96_9BACL|nr:5-methylcytosine-specific restriction endonuclease system specificity protein McrC [Abyssicoccus albus]RPF56540.1 5-methylcytosine-specific restriction enzyme subunit McrC [Abyssicoccus albus]